MSYSFYDKDNQDYINEYIDDLENDLDFFRQASEGDTYENDIGRDVHNSEFASDEDYE
jgi:hypothetical protein